MMEVNHNEVILHCGEGSINEKTTLEVRQGEEAFATAG